MKKNIGTQLTLYPTPAVVVGAKVNGSIDWTLVAHIGIVAHDRLLVSLFGKHHINAGIKEQGHFSLNIVTENYLDRADYCGIVSGAKADKSGVFKYIESEFGSPIIDDARLTIDCKVEDIYECNGFENFICSVNATYADENILDENGKIDYNVYKPVLFEFPTYQYLRTGDVIGHCTDLGKKLKDEKGA